jgi:hypothetical protein
MSLFYHVLALFCLFGSDSFQHVKDLFVGINCLILLLSFKVYLLYYLYSRFLFLSYSSYIGISLELSGKATGLLRISIKEP